MSFSPRISLSVFALCLALQPALPARAGDFSSNISFSFSDDNIFKDAGETRKNSPNAYFGQVPANALDRVESSQFRKSSTLLSLRKEMDGAYGLTPEGGLLIRYSPDSSGVYAISDYGSYISLKKKPVREGAFGAGITFMPIDSDRFRLGRLWDVSWGGSNTFPRNFRKGLVPGVRIDASFGMTEAFVGVKSALIRSPSETILDNPGGNSNQLVERAYYAVLAGVGQKFPAGFRVDLQGAFFQKGTNTRGTVLGKPIDAGGGTGIVSWSKGAKVGDRMDLRLYYEDPLKNSLNQNSRPEKGTGFEASAEGTVLVQTLEDPSQNHSTVNEAGKAVGIAGGARFGYLRLHATFIMRDLTYIVFNVPGLVPYQALPENTSVKPELFGMISADYFFPKTGITVGVSGGVLKPAVYKASMQGVTYEGPYASEIAQGIHKLVVRGANSGDWSILPAGQDEEQVGMVRLDLKWNVGPAFSMLGELSYNYDPNLAQVFLNEMGHAERRFDEPNILGFGVVSELLF